MLSCSCSSQLLAPSWGKWTCRASAKRQMECLRVGCWLCTTGCSVLFCAVGGRELSLDIIGFPVSPHNVITLHLPWCFMVQGPGAVLGPDVRRQGYPGGYHPVQRLCPQLRWADVSVGAWKCGHVHVGTYSAPGIRPEVRVVRLVLNCLVSGE